MAIGSRANAAVKTVACQIGTPARAYHIRLWCVGVDNMW